MATQDTTGVFLCIKSYRFNALKAVKLAYFSPKNMFGAKRRAHFITDW